jgi:acyl-CoA synthetase (NDP forming)
VAGSDSVLRSPASMLQAASVAIVGASERARWASQIFGNLRQNGYRGKIHLVNPRQQTVYGERCFPSLRDIGEPVDHAMVIVPAANVADVLTDAEAAGVKSARRLAQRFSCRQQAARQRPELHGLVQLP